MYYHPRKNTRIIRNPKFNFLLQPSRLVSAQHITTALVDQGVVICKQHWSMVEATEAELLQFSVFRASLVHGINV